MLFKSLHLVRSKAQRWNSEKYVKVQNIGQCSQGSLGDAVEDRLIARPAASRNVGKVCDEEVLQRKFVESNLVGPRISSVSSQCSCQDLLKPQHSIPTSLWGKDWYITVIGYNISIFLPNSHSNCLIGNYIFLLSFFLVPGSCLSPPLLTMDTKGAKYFLHLPLAMVRLGQ